MDEIIDESSMFDEGAENVSCQHHTLIDTAGR